MSAKQRRVLRAPSTYGLQMQRPTSSYRFAPAALVDIALRHVREEEERKAQCGPVRVYMRNGVPVTP